MNKFIKIVKYRPNTYVAIDEDSSNLNIILQGVTDWEEISEEEYKELDNNIDMLNRNTNKYVYLILEQTKAEEVFKNYKSLIEHMKKEQKDREEKEQQRKNQILEEKRLRKLKKLEKLKKELQLNE